MPTVRAQPLTAGAFARFGNVIEPGGSGRPVNQGRAMRIDLPLDMTSHDPRAARLQAALYRIGPSALPFNLGVVERHPLSPQLFHPNRAARFLICVFDANPDGEPDLATAQAFVGNAGQGIVYRAGVWHGPLVALEAPTDFLMQMWQCDGPLDCEERFIAPPIGIVD